MSKKGKLYELIDEVRKNMKTQVNMPCYIDDEMIKYWLDEVKKSYPKWEDASKGFRPDYAVAYPEQVASVLNSLRERWFIENFGDIE